MIDDNFVYKEDAPMCDKNSAIGVFDSGIGGLTAVKELSRLLPNEDIIYLGDTARVPYGTKSRDTIAKYAYEDANFLRSKGVKMIIAACGTVSSVMADDGEFTKGLYTGVIEPTVWEATKKTKNKKIGVIGTLATIRSQSYEKMIKRYLTDGEVFTKACPMFVPLVENGYIKKDCAPAVEIAREYLLPLKEAGIDTLILGCTHYPLLEDIISDIMGEGVTLISSGGEAGKYSAKLLSKNGLLKEGNEKGKITLYCTDSAELFRENAEHFLSGLENVEVIGCDLG